MISLKITFFPDECDVGRFYDTKVSSCQNCRRHYYQDKVGQSFCHPCELGYKTQGEGTNSANGCKGTVFESLLCLEKQLT